MARLRIKLELNPGGDGIRLDKLANLSGELEKFLRNLGRDCGVSSNLGEWVARGFYEGSMGAYVEHVGHVEPVAAQKFNVGFRKLSTFRQDKTRLNGEFSEATYRSFVDIGSRLDTDEVVKIGLFDEPEDALDEEASIEIEPEWTTIAKRTTVEVEEAVLREIEYYGSIQGRLANWHRESELVHIRESVTGSLIRCNYRADTYDAIYRAYKDRKAVVHITGRIKSDRLSGNPREVFATDVQVFDRLDDEEFFGLSGAAPDFIGDRSASDFLDEMRDDGE